MNPADFRRYRSYIVWPRRVESAERCRATAASSGGAVVAQLVPAPTPTPASGCRINGPAAGAWCVSLRPAHFGAVGDAADAMRGLGLPSASWDAVLSELSTACASLGVTMPTAGSLYRDAFYPPAHTLLVAGFVPLAVVVFGIVNPRVSHGAMFGIILFAAVVVVCLGEPYRQVRLRARNNDAAAAIYLTETLRDGTSAAGAPLAAAGLTARVVEVDLSIPSCWCSASRQRACERRCPSRVALPSEFWQLFLVLEPRGAAAGYEAPSPVGQSLAAP